MTHFMKAALFASLHYIGFAIALGSIFGRGVYLKKLHEDSQKQNEDLKRVFFCDNLWGVAALLIIVTGFYRAFGSLEKGTDFYLGSGLFNLKLGLFGLIFLLELYPMVVLFKWRIKNKRGVFEFHKNQIKTLVYLNHSEFILVLLIPFIASLMARGF